MFRTFILSAVTVMSVYVGWRARSVPALRRVPWIVRALVLVVLGCSFIAARHAEAAGFGLTARVLEIVGGNWIGVLLLFSLAMLGADLATGFGLFFRRHLPVVRAWALVAGAGLSAVAFVQGMRPPVVRDYEVRIDGLRQEDDGLVLVFVSDMHLGSLIGERWIAARVEQISALRPDAILVGGDVLEGDSRSEWKLLPALARLRAPLGVWAVAGNHEHHGPNALTELEHLGFHVLRDEWKELRPGLVLAGVDSARDAHGAPPATEQLAGSSRSDPLARALEGRPPAAATILLSHVPVRVADAARAGVGLMLSGHTHDGQIWPFRYIVRTRFPYLAGRYDVGGMPLIVCRGTGTFGPRMRLWLPGEILRITLRAPIG